LRYSGKLTQEEIAMSDERDKVLAMLQDGVIDAEQADELLGALAPEAEAKRVTAVSEAVGDIPDMDHYRRFWVAPFSILTALTTLLALWLRASLSKNKGPFSIGRIFVFGLFLISLVLSVLAFLSRKSTWAHVRIQEKSGNNIAISLPLPLSLAGKFIDLARQNSPEEMMDNLEMAATAIAAAQESFNDPHADPIMIDVDDENAHVQVFIG
jgi:hypothetical protein